MENVYKTSIKDFYQQLGSLTNIKDPGQLVRAIKQNGLTITCPKSVLKMISDYFKKILFDPFTEKALKEIIKNGIDKNFLVKDLFKISDVEHAILSLKFNKGLGTDLTSGKILKTGN